MSNKKTVQLFIASSKEVKKERDRVILIFHSLNKAYPNLHIDPVLWEYDMPRCSYPEFALLQDAINSYLADCNPVVFIFYSRIGKYTRQEFEYSFEKKKSVFVFFKRGFKPDKKTEESFDELVAFEASIQDVLVPIDFKTSAEFNYAIYEQLNLYVSKLYGVTPLMLNIDELQETLNEQEKIIAELKVSLAKQIDNQELIFQTQKALEEGNYTIAKEFLKERSKDSISNAASTFFELGRIEELELNYEKAFEYFEIAVKITPDNGLYLHHAGTIAFNLGFFKTAFEYHQKSVINITKVFGNNSKEIAFAYNGIAGVLMEREEFQLAIEYFQKSLAIILKLDVLDPINLAKNLNNLGLAYQHAKEVNKAITQYHKALETLEKGGKKKSVVAAIVYNNIGMSYNSINENMIAHFNFEKALEIFIALFPNDHPKMGNIYNNIGVIYFDLGDLNKSQDCYYKALAIDRKFFGDEHPNIATDYHNLALSYFKESNYSKAFDCFKSALNIRKKFFPNNHTLVLQSKQGLADAKAAII